MCGKDTLRLIDIVFVYKFRYFMSDFYQGGVEISEINFLLLFFCA